MGSKRQTYHNAGPRWTLRFQFITVWQQSLQLGVHMWVPAPSLWPWLNSLVTASIQCTIVCIVQHTFLPVYVPQWTCTHLRVRIYVHKTNICRSRSTPDARMYRKLEHRSRLHGHYGVNRLNKYECLKEPLHESNKEVAIADLFLEMLAAWQSCRISI